MMMPPPETKEKLWDVVCGHCGFVAGKVAYRERIHHMEVDHPSHKWSVCYNGFGFFACPTEDCHCLVVTAAERCPYCQTLVPEKKPPLRPPGPVRVID